MSKVNIMFKDKETDYGKLSLPLWVKSGNHIYMIVREFKCTDYVFYLIDPYGERVDEDYDDILSIFKDDPDLEIVDIDLVVKNRRV